MRVSKGVSATVIDKAVVLLTEALNPDSPVRPRKIKARGGCYLSLKVDYHYRLLFKRNEWLLMTHEKYNKACF